MLILSSHLKCTYRRFAYENITLTADHQHILDYQRISCFKPGREDLSRLLLNE